MSHAGRRASNLPAPTPDVWIDEGPVEASPPVGKPKRSRRATKVAELPELKGLVGAKRAAALQPRVAAAADAFAHERYPEALRVLRPLVEEVPESASIQELTGLTQYRLGRWTPAAKHLEAFRQLTGGSTEQHPVLADCYRALRRYGKVDKLWEELREASPNAELVTEGRIVAAGALADRGRVEEAIALLERNWRAPQHPRDHHLRRAYALARLYERAGDVPRARSTFAWILRHDPAFSDSAERAAGLA